MKKILVDKTESTSSVVHKILGTMERDIVLVLPKKSKAGASLNNFHILHREAEAAGKELSIESVDEEVLAFAKVAGIEGNHPFLGKRPAMQDIVPMSQETGKRTAEAKRRAVLKEEAPTLRESGDRSPDPLRRSSSEASRSVGKELPAILSEPEEEKPEKEERKLPRKKTNRRTRLVLAICAGILVLIGTGVWTVGAFFGRADVAVKLEEIKWDYSGPIIADATVSKVKPAEKIIPGEVFSLDRNVTQPFPASGSQNVEEYARGTFVIYNSYSSTPQTLVATTRFSSSDGKIFRLVEKVVVPGAVIQNGKIFPASTTAMVVADKPGAEFNVGPIEKLTIPGLRGTPKFEGFYGVLSEGAKGGYIGVKKVPTAKDLEAGKSKTAEVLKSILQNLFVATKPTGFRVVEGGTTFTLKRITVNEKTDAQGNFNIFGEATLSGVGFREEDLKELVMQYAGAEHRGVPLSFRSFGVDIRSGTFDSSSRRETLSADVHAVLTASFVPEELKSSLAGLSVEKAQAEMSKVTGLEEGKISLWPFWLRTVPQDPNKIRVKVE